MKKVFVFLIFLSSISFLSAGVVPKPKEGMSVEQLIKIWDVIKYTKFAKDYTSYSRVILINRSGFKRTRKAYRARIILNGKGGFEYKDYVSFIYPAAFKGLTILTWTYSDPNKEREQWLYLPSLKKARRASPSEDEDNFMGTVFTTEEITSWKPNFETYKLIGIKKFDGYVSNFDKKEYYKGVDCYVIEAFPKPERKVKLRSKRRLWLRKNDGCCIFQEVYGKNGKIYKVLFRSYRETGPNKYPAQIIVEGVDYRTKDVSIVHMDEIHFDVGLKESDFTVEKLKKMKW